MEGEYWEIEQYVYDLSDDLDFILRGLDDECFEARQDDVPIYLTKGRIKTVNSLYLKTKRKGEHYKDITDVGGFRVLCLFEKDLLSVHAFLLKLYRRHRYVVNECIVYNWDEKSVFYAELYERTKSVYSYRAIPFKFTPKDKISGYRSIHYLLEKTYKGRVFKIEIQLRTIVQDVWGEIEHEIAYKKASVRPYVKESVRLLAKDLQNIDDLFSHLRAIQEKERGGDYYSNYKQGPKHILDYESKIIDKVFDNNNLKDKYDKYSQCLREYNRDSVSDKWLEKMRANLIDFKSELNLRRGEWEVDYWLSMEGAFIDFSECRYDEALGKYLSIEERLNKRYCVCFRIGEIYSIVGDMVASLAYFDKVERLVSLYGKDDYLNQYRIKMRLAMIYWSLGGGFIDTAIKKINDAERLYKKCRKKENDKGEMIFSDEDFSRLVNNLCYYYLEKYLYEKDNMDNKDKESYVNDCYVEANKKYRKLARIMKNGILNRNALDTASWFLYHKYNFNGEKKYLKQAVDLCLKMKEYENKTVYSIRSVNLQKDHVQEIMSKAEEVLGLNRKIELEFPIVKCYDKA